MPDSDTPLRPPLVLLADDQEWSSRSLESILGPNGYAVLRAYTGRQAMELARSAQPDLLILDAKLPDLSGIEVCRLVRADPRFNATTPIVVTSSAPSERSQRIDAYVAGAWEYFGQPIDSEVFLHKLNTYMRSKRETDHVRSESFLDEATGLYTIRGLARRAHELGALAQRRHEPLTCLAFAPDVPPDVAKEESAAEQATSRSASVLEWVGHVGEIAKRTGRESDAVGRLGQTEFGIVAPETDAEGALRLLDRLRQSVEALPLTLEGRARGISIRAGYCAVPDAAASPVDAVEMLLRATATLRECRMDPTGARIRAFNAAPPSTSPPPISSASP